MTLLRALIVDDSEKDAILLLSELQKAGYSPIHKRVDTGDEMERALAEQEWDVVLCDYIMPSFSGLAALKVLRQLEFDVPFIVVSGQIGEDVAVEAMKAGANDYIMKGNLKRLVPAIQRELIEAKSRKSRRSAEQELKAREEELCLAKKADQLKDAFIGMVSHELKTPLTVIMGALSVAMTDGLPMEQVKELNRDAFEYADKLARIVDNLLELSRHQSNRLILQTRQTEIKAVIQTVLRKLNTRSDIHKFAIDVPSSLPAAMIDPTRIELVIHNLMENAIKYSPQGGEIRVFAHHQDTQIVIGVSDHGIGISPEDQSRLFQDFQRLEVEKHHNIPGVGLGLKVCRVLVETHGGQIWVDSSPGEGSTFCFSLPMAHDKG